MDIYTAAVYTNNYMPGQKQYGDLNDHEKAIVQILPNILESYHYVNRPQYVEAMRKDNAKVFIDSGAFSAYTLGVEIDLPTYCNYINQNIDIIRHDDGVVMASVLDGIGDPLQTYRNQLAMEAHGAKPLPCFHYGEDERYLDFYIKNYQYITIGGMVPVSNKQLIPWLDRLWDKWLTDGSGTPRLKVHGFGLTSIPLMRRYPWYSVDSSSWIQATAFGTIITPKHNALSISEKSPSRHTAGQHISTLAAVEQDYIFKMLESQGFNYERLSTTYQSRAAYNLWAFGEINAIINEAKNTKFKAHIQELF